MLAERSHPLVVRIWFVGTILSLYRESYKQYFCQRVLSQNVGRKENPRHGDTVSFISSFRSMDFGEVLSISS